MQRIRTEAIYHMRRGAKRVSAVCRRGFLLGAAEWVAMIPLGFIISAQNATDSHGGHISYAERSEARFGCVPTWISPGCSRVGSNDPPGLHYQRSECNGFARRPYIKCGCGRNRNLRNSHGRILDSNGIWLLSE